MNTIKLTKNSGFYYPKDDGDMFLMQHCINEDLSAVNEAGLKKIQFLAAAHGWKVEIV